MCLPVFLTNVVFSNSFRDTARADISFASNLLGIMTGGMLEYFSMLIGYHMLLWFVIAFYALATVLRLSSFKSGARVAAVGLRGWVSAVDPRNALISRTFN